MQQLLPDIPEEVRVQKLSNIGRRERFVTNVNNALRSLIKREKYKWLTAKK